MQRHGLKVKVKVKSVTSVQFSRSVVSDSLRPHESKHARPPCPSPTPGVHPDSRPSSQWYHLAISSAVVPFSSCPQSLPASESFPMSHYLLQISSQSIGVSASASVLPMNIQDWFPLGWTGLVFRGKEKWHNKYMDTLKIISSTFFIQILLSLSESNQKKPAFSLNFPIQLKHITHTHSTFWCCL